MNSVLVWIQIPKLPVEYYEKILLCKIAKGIEKLIKIGAHTLREGARPMGASEYAERVRSEVCKIVKLIFGRLICLSLR